MMNTTSSSLCNSSSPTQFFPPLTEEDVYTLFNKRACDSILPAKLKKILDWGCNKLPHESFWQFLQQKINSEDWRKYSKRWSKGDQKKLHQINPDGFDVTFLIKLIPDICEGISGSGTYAWTTNDETTVECLLKKIKDLRNDIMHEPRGAAISPLSFTEMERLIVEILKVLGNKYHIRQDIINTEILDCRRLMSDLKETTMTDKQKRLLQIQKRMVKDGVVEMRLRFTQHTNVVTPIARRKVSLTDVFHQLKLKSETTDDHNHPQEIISCTTLFNKYSDNDPNMKRFIVIEGIPGSGKSTLLRRIAQDFLKVGMTVFHGLDSYELMLFIECRDPNKKTLGDLLRMMYRKSTEKVEIEDAEQACDGLKKLILVDGLDELNANSKALLTQLIQLYGHQIELATFVLSSRPHAVHSFSGLLQELGIQTNIYRILRIEELKEQVSLLDKYQTTLECEKSSITKAYESLDKQVQSHFNTPIHLALFFDAYNHSDQQVERWTSESGAMKETLKLCQMKMVERLDQHGVLDTNVIARMVVQCVCKQSLTFLMQDIFYVDAESYENLCIAIYDRVKQKLNVNELLSCIWAPRHSFHDNNAIDYEFFHKSHQEYMAARHLYDTLRKHPKKTLTQIILEETQVELTDYIIQKLLNVLKFLIIELHVSSKLSAYLLEIRQLLERVEVQFSYCVDLVRCCDDDPPLAEELAKVKKNPLKRTDNTDTLTKEEKGWWVVSSNLMIKATTLMLRHRTPNALEVNLPSSSEVPESLKDLFLALSHQDYKGVLILDLWNSYEQFKPCDDIIAPLADISCCLWRFRGCISKESSAKIFRRIGKKGRLFISVPDYSRHQLQLLRHTPFMLDVTLPYSHNSRRSPSPRPLPDSPTPRDISERDSLPPRLTVVDVPPDGGVGLLRLISSLAPKNKRFCDVRLQKCSVTDTDLEWLLQELRSEGISTEGFQKPSWNAIGTSNGGVCYQCQYVHEEPSVRCIRLHIASSPASTFQF